jgi:hypothetical protein
MFYVCFMSVLCFMFVCLFGVNNKASGYNYHLMSSCSSTAAMTWAAIDVSHFIPGGISTHLAGR